MLTRPLDVSIVDWLAKPTSDGGFGIGAAAVSVGFAVLIAILVGYLTVTGNDVQRSTRCQCSPPIEPGAALRVGTAIVEVTSGGSLCLLRGEATDPKDDG